MDSIFRELRFALRDRVVVLTLLGTLLFSSYTVINGLHESDSELAMIERVQQMVSDDREYKLAKQSDAGAAAYYTFHFTYNPPSSLAFASRGIRDNLPWKHRIRMLALEGQIYETDSGNPELSRIGKLDFAFLAAFLLPLLSILLLYDLRAVEVRNNRWAFLSVTSGSGAKLLLSRAVLRSVLLFVCVLAPFLVAAVVNSAAVSAYFGVIGAVGINIAFWCLIALFVLSRLESGPTTAAVLLGCWFTLAVAVPVGGKYIVEQSIAVPKGGELLLTQREAVNDAWDLPKEATMTPFYERHPTWSDSATVSQFFEWKWYYAFQQVGDQTIEPLSKKLRNGITRRDRAMKGIALLSPPLLTERLLSKAAKTDVASFQRYDNCVRQFHGNLREFYYPMLFGNIEFSLENMQGLPNFSPCVDPI